MRPVARLCLGLSLAALAVVPLLAAPPSPVAKPVPVAPDDQLLEFLADWQGADGKWVDPLTFAAIDPAKLSAAKTAPPKKVPAPATHIAPGNQPAKDAGRAR